jgi:putative tetratricopeptide repeat-containing protein
MSNKVNFFGYDGKLTYENQNTGMRTMEMDIDLLHKISRFTVNVMKEEQFNAKEVIRGFRLTSNGDFSFKCGVGYRISDELVGGSGSGVMSNVFDLFLAYDKDQNKENLDILNKYIESQKTEINRAFPNADKFEGFNKEYEKGKEDKLKDLDIEVVLANYKQDMLEYLDDNFLTQYVDDPSKYYLSSNNDMQIKDFLDSEHFKESLKRETEYAMDNIEVSTEDLVKKYNLEDKLPAFRVFTDEGMAFASDDGGYGYQDSKGRMIEPDEREKMEETIIDLKSKEYLDNMDMYDIKSWEDLNNTGMIQVYFEGYDGYQFGDVAYTDYDDYAKPTVDDKLKEVFTEKLEEMIKDVKEIVEKEDYIKEENFDKLKEKYQKEVDNVEKEYYEFKNELKKDNKSKNEYEEKETEKDEKEMDM